jgi:DNA-binding MarR family transcriptional regulator
MHCAMFGLKRAYWGSLRVTRKRLAKMGLTAARFDLLYALLVGRVPMAQWRIVRQLGVAPPVVSRMLKSLRMLGYVSQRRNKGDGRGRLVVLTDLGRSKIRRAVLVFIRRRRADLLVERGLCPGMPLCQEREDAAFERMGELEWLLDKLREGFRAGGKLYYPWHPDE